MASQFPNWVNNIKEKKQKYAKGVAKGATGVILEDEDALDSYLEHINQPQQPAFSNDQDDIVSDQLVLIELKVRLRVRPSAQSNKLLYQLKSEKLNIQSGTITRIDEKCIEVVTIIPKTTNYSYIQKVRTLKQHFVDTYSLIKNDIIVDCVPFSGLYLLWATEHYEKKIISVHYPAEPFPESPSDQIMNDAFDQAGHGFTVDCDNGSYYRVGSQS